MKRMTQKSLRTFAETLTEAVEEIADKIGTIETILNGGDDGEEEVIEEPAVEDTTPAEEPATDEDTTTEEPAVADEGVSPEAPAEEAVADEGVAPETETEQFSENRYQSVKDWLSQNVNF